MKAEPFNAMIDRKRADRMRRIDNLSPELRALIHAYGFAVVDNCMQLGIAKPKQIKHLVELILDEFSPTRGSYSKQGPRTEVGTTSADAGERVTA